jgi:ribosomal protein S18 acetylase RimI-like enzyme
MTRPEEFTIARLEHGDLDVLEPLWSALREHHAAVAPTNGPPRTRAESWRRRRLVYERLLRDEDSFALVACRDGDPLGYAMVHVGDGSQTWPHGDRSADLETLAVAPYARGAGLGSAFVSAVRAELARLGIARLSLFVIATNDDAIRFYRRHGFATSGLWLESVAPVE